MNGITGKQIKSVRDKHNLSQDGFGRKLGLSGKTISAYETGRSIPSKKVLNKISSVYSTSLSNSKVKNIEYKIKRIQRSLNELNNLLKTAFPKT